MARPRNQRFVYLAIVLSGVGMVCGAICFVFGASQQSMPIAFAGWVLGFPSILYLFCVHFSYQLCGRDFSLLGTKRPAAIPQDLTQGPLLSSYLTIPDHVSMSYPLAAWRVSPSGVALFVRVFARQAFYLPWDSLTTIQPSGGSTAIHHTSPELRSPLMTGRYVGEIILSTAQNRKHDPDATRVLMSD